MIKLIILDIDGTLISSNSSEHNIIIRPHLKEFLGYLFENIEHVAIWTAAGKIWCDIVYEYIKNFIPNKKNFLFKWSEERCTRVIHNDDIYNGNFYAQQIIFKKLAKVFRKYKNININKYNTIIIDDNPLTYKSNYGNAIPIYEFQNNSNDDYLLKLCTYLNYLNLQENQRTIEKRNWYLNLQENPKIIV
jgi:hydroxymethylpyrimidine pyrophosphatase-like HAD family hydrolase